MSSQRRMANQDSDVSSGWSSGDDVRPPVARPAPTPARLAPPDPPSAKVIFKPPSSDLATLYRQGQQQSIVTNEKLVTSSSSFSTPSRKTATAPAPPPPTQHNATNDSPAQEEKKKKPRKKKIVVNLSRCKYDIVRECVEAMGWVIDDDQEGLAAFANMLKETKEKEIANAPTPIWSPGGAAVANTASGANGGAVTAGGQVDVSALLTALLQSERCQILWSDVSVLTQNVARLKPWQRVNHFPQMSLICRKVQLGKQLNRMAGMFPDVYDFFPLSFSSRSDLSAIATYCRKTKNKKTFILKPNAGCQGIGIVLSRQPDKIIPVLPHEDYIVQLYITRPLLIEKKKFDMRVYVLVLSVAPLKVLIYDEGLVRMCTKDYVKPKPSNMSQTTMHLTNYAVNKKSDDFAFGGAQCGAQFTTETGKTFSDDGDGSKGYKRDFAFLKRFIEANFGEHMYKLLWQRIERAVILTILSAYHQIKHAYLSSNPAGKGSDNRTCFELLGYDVLLDDECNPYVLEVNHSPSFGTDSAIDYRIKRRLLIDVMKHVNPYLIDVKRASDHQYRNMLKKKVWPDADLYLMGTGFRPIYPPEAIEERVRIQQEKKLAKEQREAAAALKPEDDSGSDGDDVENLRPAAPTPGDEDDRVTMTVDAAVASAQPEDDNASEEDEDDGPEDKGVPLSESQRLWSYLELRELYDSIIEATTDTLPGQTSLRTQKAMAAFTNTRRENIETGQRGGKPVLPENRSSLHSAPQKPAPKAAGVLTSVSSSSFAPPRSTAAAGSGASAVRRKSLPSENNTPAAATTTAKRP